jgi:hypothetical protein
MPYIGKSIESGTFSDLGFTGTFNSSTTDFNLGTQVGSPAQLIVSKNGVIQRPGTDFTLASGGSQISFTTAPASGDSIFIVEISGAVGGPLDSDLNGTELILDTDGDTSITADTDDQIDIKVAGTDQITIKDGAVSPVTDNDVDLGTTSLEFKDGYFDGTLHCDVLDLAGTEYTSIAGGKIGQVLQTVKTDVFSTTSSSFVDVTGLSRAITPSATSSKVLVNVTLTIHSSDNSLPLLLRGSTVIALGDAASNRTRTFGSSSYSGHMGAPSIKEMSVMFLDSPNSSSEVTYKVQGAAIGGGTMYFGRGTADTDNSQHPRTIQTITCMEVLA